LKDLRIGVQHWATWNYFKMVLGISILILSWVVGFAVIKRIGKGEKMIDQAFLKGLFFYHLALSVCYYLYALFNPSDSKSYFRKVTENYRGESWSDFYGSSTTFIEWIGYPFIKYLNFSYEGMMALFSFFGFLGFVFLYVFFREHLKFRHTVRGYNLLHLFFLLPNLHFWSASFGKGAVIFFGIGLFFYGITKVNRRIIAVVLGGLIIYHVRPHIMLVILVSAIIGFFFSTPKMTFFFRAGFLILAGISLFYIYSDVLTMVGLEEDELFTEGIDLSHRATQLTKATSGIDITNYSFAEKLFAFWYRPLFFDAPGALGFIVSFENLFYLLISLRFMNFSALQFLLKSDAYVKTALFSFITVSIALAQISGNLGLAMRQKSQVMPLFLFCIIKWLDELKRQRFAEVAERRKRMAQQDALLREQI
jgi:hypothetical protein